MKKYDVPVLVYHSVGIPNKKWNWNYLTCPFEKFETHIKFLKENGYQTITLNKLYGYMVEGKSINDRSVVITFDDGYLDNWIYAYPILKKYGMCGTVFVNPQFVDKRSIIREYYSFDNKVDHLETSGFLSWEEIRIMDQEGVIFTESHALTHTWYPTSSEIVDFRHPNDSYVWMTWNKNEELKPFLQIDNIELKTLGSPVYKFEKSLLSRQYYPDLKLSSLVEKFVEDSGGQKFFEQHEWKKILFAKVNDNNISGYYETLDSYKKRVENELDITKKILEEKLEREIIFLCWPGGSASEIGMDIAIRLGYKFFNSARDMDIIQRKSVKNIAKGGNRIKRITPLLYWDGVENFSSNIIYANKLWFRLMLLHKSNEFFMKYVYGIFKRMVNFYYKFKSLLRSK